MKKKILSLIKKRNFELLKYNSYRSDMGCQCFDIQIKKDGEVFLFDYGYYYGGGKNELIKEFIDFINSIDSRYDIYGGYNDPCYASPLL